MKNIFSKITLLFIAISMLYITGTEQRYRKTVIEWDVATYYAYLPGLFIYKDLKFSFLDTHQPSGGNIWTEKTQDNKRVLKMTSGLAILYAPFFFIAHGIALLQPEMYAPNGYSMIYSLFLILSDLFYTLLGLYFLRKILILYFSDSITSITLLAVYFSTNLLFYSLFEVMAHNYLFCLITVFLYQTILWHKKSTLKKSIFIGLIFGLITLIRPVDFLVFLVFVLYGISSSKDFKEKISFFWNRHLQLAYIALFSFLVICIQMMYWKYATGHFLFWSYTTEKFYLTQPEIIKGLFGFRKGWFIYTPIMFFATLGLGLTYRYCRNFAFGFSTLFIVFTYIIFSWWCWWYGGGVSCRPMIDIYGILAIGLASFLTFIYTKTNAIIKVVMTLVLITCFYYGVLTNKQYYIGVLHYDSMTWESWKENFMKTEVSSSYYDALHHPNYDKARDYGTEE